MSGLTLMVAETTHDGWRYAAWIAFDVRLLLIVAALAVLIAGASAALTVRAGRPRDYASVFALVTLLAIATLSQLFNACLSQPVLVVESVFPFP
jgi:hypothetical protein